MGSNDLSLHPKCTGCNELAANIRLTMGMPAYRRVYPTFSPDIPELMDHVRRLRLLRRQMRQQGIDSLLITQLADVRYLCGFTGSNAVLGITAHRAAMF